MALWEEVVEEKEQGQKYQAPATGVGDWQEVAPVPFEESKSNYAQPVTTPEPAPTSSVPERLIVGAAKNVGNIVKGISDIATEYPKMLWDIGVGVKDIATTDKSLGEVGGEFISKRLPVKAVTGLYGGVKKAGESIYEKGGTGTEGLKEIGKEIGNWMIDNPIDTALFALPALGAAGKAAGAAGMTKTAGAIEGLTGGAARGALYAGEYVASKIPYIRRFVIPVEKQLNAVIDNGITQGLKFKPSKAGAGGMRRSMDDLREAVRDVVETKPAITDVNGQLVRKPPENVFEHLEAVTNTKKAVLDDMKLLEQKAGSIAPTVDYTPLVKTLREKAIDLELSDGARAYAAKQADYFEALKGNLSSISKTQQRLAEVNERLSTQFKDPAFVNNAKTIDEITRKQLLELGDKAIESAGGAGWRDIRKKWGRLKALEDQSVGAVVKQMNAKAGQGGIGDQFLGAEVMWSIASGNPSYALAGFSGKAIQIWSKYMMSPNRAIKNMYKTANTLMNQMPKRPSNLVMPERLALPPGRPGEPPHVYNPGTIPVTPEGDVLLGSRVHNPYMAQPTVTPGRGYVKGVTGEYPPNVNQPPMARPTGSLYGAPNVPAVQTGQLPVPVGSPRGVIPPGSPVPVTQERLSIANRRIDPAQASVNRPMTELEIKKARMRLKRETNRGSVLYRGIQD